MLKINFYQKNNQFCGFSAIGHANSNEYGYDVVCAKVSLISQSILCGLKDYLKLNFYYSIDNGFLEFEISEYLENEDVSFLFNFMLNSFVNLEKSNSKFMKLIFNSENESKIFFSKEKTIKEIKNEVINFNLPRLDIIISRVKDDLRKFEFKNKEKNIFYYSISELFSFYNISINEIYGDFVSYNNDKLVFKSFEKLNKLKECLYLSLKSMEKTHPKNLKLIEKNLRRREI